MPATNKVQKEKNIPEKPIVKKTIHSNRSDKDNGKTNGNKNNSFRENLHSSKLYRSETNKMIAGVAGGLSEYFNVDATLVRLIFILLTVFGGSGVLIYLILWLVMPAQSSLGASTDDTIKKNTDEIRDRAQVFAANLRTSHARNNSRQLLGVILLLFGLAILLSNFGFFRWFNIDRLWPIILIVIGFAILARDGER